MTRLEYALAAMAKAWALTSPVPGITPKPVAVAIEQASSEKPLFAASDGWKQTVDLMTAIARYESGFVADAKGDCKDKPAGWPGCGATMPALECIDDGPWLAPFTCHVVTVRANEAEPTSFCFMQIHLPDGVKTAEGWSSDELLADPLKCARAGREIIRKSILASPAGQPLLQYAGRASAAALRFDLAKQLFKLVPWTEESK